MIAIIIIKPIGNGVIIEPSQEQPQVLLPLLPLVIFLTKNENNECLNNSRSSRSTFDATSSRLFITFFLSLFRSFEYLNFRQTLEASLRYSVA